MISPINTAPAQTTQTHSVSANISIPKYIPLTIIILGFLTAFVASANYSGKFLITFLTSPGKHPLLTNDVLGIPNAGFDYLHNINKFPAEVLAQPSAFKLLNIITGSIKVIPKEIGAMTNLHTLQIGDNNLKSLPGEIGNLSELESLNLGGNKLKTIPESIRNLTKLKKLYLYNNKIVALPESIGDLSSLEILDLHSNSLKSLPQEIGNLINLKTLYLGGNSISKVEQQNIRNALPNTQIFF
ncbi:MAG TPA: leucine-rich repeat domain-containing protein [Patescibacteria group bacterium]|nr:leucine-rich repeat domain-containing protein [Patescibacteria group bacterium]